MKRSLYAAVLLAGLLGSALAGASSDEAWLHRAALPPGSTPLLVLLVDTSAAMAGVADVPLPYDPARDYAPQHPGTPCQADRVYWRLGPGPAPDCDSSRWISATTGDTSTGLHCQAGEIALATTGVFVAQRAAQWVPRGTGGFWGPLSPGEDHPVECREDRGRHGTTAGAWFAADGPRGPWHSSDADEPRWDAPPLSDAYVFFTGNYLNYLASGERMQMTRLAWLVRRIADAARSVQGLELALVRLSHDGLGGGDDGRGGMVALAPARLPEAVPTLVSMLEEWLPAGPAPLAETLAEVLRWLAGEPLYFGLDSHAAPGHPLASTAAVRDAADSTRYLTPFVQACRPVLLGIATAGVASADDGAAAALDGLPVSGAAADCAGDCLALVTQLLANADLLPTTPGAQRVEVRFLAPAGSSSSLAPAVAAGGRPPLDLDDRHAVTTLLAHALQNDAAVGIDQRISAAGLEYTPFAAPDRAVYYGLSAAVSFPPWPGNLRRYRLAAPDAAVAGPAVTDRNDGPVVDAGSGRLVPGSRSEWSSLPDGEDITRGGAAAQLPDTGSRRVFTDLTTEPLTAAANRFTAGNAALTRARLALEPGDPRSVSDVIARTLGRDALDEDADGDRDEPRGGLGDPGLQAPRVLRYAADGPALAFVATGDGLLHAFDADTGEERWGFLPAILLPRLAGLAPGYRSLSRGYGLDGLLTLAWHDLNHDGRLVVEDGDRAWLLGGLGRGGTGYFALDVIDPAAPRLLWSLDAGDLPGFGQSWPAPVLARMRLADGSVQRVAVLAGGFDPAEDAAVAPARSLGAAVAIIDLDSGRLLWRAGAAGPDTDLAVPALQRSAATPPRVLDADGDGLDDRLYLLDIAGVLLRVDFPRGEISADASATLLARLGSDPPAGPRRFLATLDVVPIERDGARQLAIAAGSGWLSRPREPDVDDAFFVVFDDLAGPGRSPALEEADLADVTAPPHEAPPGTPGWMLRLAGHGSGEKTAGASFTFDHRLRFATYQPRPPADDAPCGPPAGVSRVYTLDVRSGRPLNWIGDQPVPDEPIVAAGLPPGLDVAFPAAPDGTCGSGGCARHPFALAGGNSIPLGFSNDPVRTSWRQLDAKGQ